MLWIKVIISMLIVNGVDSNPISRLPKYSVSKYLEALIQDNNNIKTTTTPRKSSNGDSKTRVLRIINHDQNQNPLYRLTPFNIARQRGVKKMSIRINNILESDTVRRVKMLREAHHSILEVEVYYHNMKDKNDILLVEFMTPLHSLSKLCLNNKMFTIDVLGRFLCDGIIIFPKRYSRKIICIICMFTGRSIRRRNMGYNIIIKLPEYRGRMIPIPRRKRSMKPRPNNNAININQSQMKMPERSKSKKLLGNPESNTKIGFPDIYDNDLKRNYIGRLVKTRNNRKTKFPDIDDNDLTRNYSSYAVKTRNKRAKSRPKPSIKNRLQALIRKNKNKKDSIIIDPDDILDPGFLHSNNATEKGFTSEWKTMRKSLLKMRHEMSKEQMEYSKIMSKVKGLLDEGEKINEELHKEDLFKRMDAKVESEFSKEIEKTRREYERKIDEENEKRLKIEKKLISYDASRKLDNIEKQQKHARHKLAGRLTTRERLGVKLKLVDPLKDKTVEQEVKDIIQEGLGDSRIFDLDTVNKQRLVEGFDQDLTEVDDMLDTILHSSELRPKRIRYKRNIDYIKKRNGQRLFFQFHPKKVSNGKERANDIKDNKNYDDTGVRRGRKHLVKKGRRNFIQSLKNVNRKINSRISVLLSTLKSQPQIISSRRKRNSDESSDKNEDDEYFTNTLQSLAIPSPVDILQSDPKISVPSNFFDFHPPGTPLYDDSGNVLIKHKQEITDDMPEVDHDEEYYALHPDDDDEKSLQRLRSNWNREKFKQVLDGYSRSDKKLVDPPKKFKFLAIDDDSLTESINHDDRDSKKPSKKTVLALLGLGVESELQKHKDDMHNDDNDNRNDDNKHGDNDNNDKYTNNKNKKNSNNNNKEDKTNNDNNHNTIPINNNVDKAKENHHNNHHDPEQGQGSTEYDDFVKEIDQWKQKHDDTVYELTSGEFVNKAIQGMLWESAAEHDVNRLKQDLKQIASMLRDAETDLEMVEAVRMGAIQNRTLKWKKENKNDDKQFRVEMKQLREDIDNTNKYLKSRQPWN